MSTIMVVRRTAKQIKCEGYKVEVNGNSFLVFESKKHYKNIKEVEKDLFDLVNKVINGYEGEDGDFILIKPEVYLPACFYSIAINLKYNPFTKVNVIENEINDDDDDPFEIMFATLVYFFMTNHDEEEG